jgi:hypothetical protein
MKNGVIAAKKSTWRSKLDLDYLNEESEVKERQQTKEDRKVGAQLRQFNAYASKEFTGNVHVAGFLHDRVAANPDGSNTPPAHLGIGERQKRIVRAWKKILNGPCLGKGAKKDVVQHRLVFSMSDEMYRACLHARINPDRVLHSMMKHALRAFADKLHSGDRIGYAYGFHHDTEHLHVHIALCPRTDKGFYVGYSEPKFQNNRSQHRNQFACIRQAFEKQNRKWGETLASPQKLRELLQKDHRFCLTPEVQPLRDAQRRAERQVDAELLHSQHATLLRLHGEIQSLLRERDYRKLFRLAGSAWSLNAFRPPKPAALFGSIASSHARRTRLHSLRTDYLSLRREYLEGLARFYSTPKPHIHHAPTKINHRQRQSGPRQRL